MIETTQRTVEKMGYSCELVNAVIMVNLKREININKLAFTFPDLVRYNPDVFCGAQIHLMEKERKLPSILIFKSGKLIISGVRNEPDLVKVLNVAIKMVNKLDKLSK